jgi:hypothetical protein
MTTINTFNNKLQAAINLNGQKILNLSTGQDEEVGVDSIAAMLDAPLQVLSLAGGTVDLTLTPTYYAFNPPRTVPSSGYLFVPIAFWIVYLLDDWELSQNPIVRVLDNNTPPSGQVLFGSTEIIGMQAGQAWQKSIPETVWAATGQDINDQTYQLEVVQNAISSVGHLYADCYLVGLNYA